jgi:phosphoglycolate phosphatase
MAIKGILFDKDGTLIDVNRTWIPLYRTLLAEKFMAGSEKVKAMLVSAGYDPVADKFISGSILACGTTRQLVEVWWPHLDDDGQAQMANSIDHDYAPLARTYLHPLMDLEPILSSLQSDGYALGIATNDSRVSAKGQMEKLGVARFFQAIIGSDSVVVPKPSGQMIKHFAEHAGILSDEIAMVGDNTHDLEEAYNGGAGLRIGVLSGNAAHEDIAHLADHVIASVADLPALLRSV